MATPTPSPSSSSTPGAYSPEQAARDAATGNNGTPQAPFYLTPVDQYKIKINKTGNSLSYGNYQFVFDTTTGYVRAEDLTNTANTIEDIAFLGDPKNNSSITYDSLNGNIMTSATAASNWLMENANTSKVTDLRTLLIAKGWLSGPAAQQSMQFGTIGDQGLAKALTTAITQISWRNVALMKTGSDPLTLEAGLQALTKVDQAYDPYADGTSTNVTRQEFKPQDYRAAVDAEFMKQRGRGASESELNIFIQTLKNMESKNPQVTTTTRKGSNTTTSTKGGVTDAAAGDALNSQIIKDPESADFQAASTYMDWFNQALDGGINLND